MTCARCPRVLAEGDTAFVQEVRKIEVRDETVQFRTVEEVVCPRCAGSSTGK